jgi:hypothetical protein
MKQHRYRITVEHLETADGAPVTDATPLTFETGNHDEILAIVERIKGRGLFDDATATSFAVGLKLFTEAMLENRTHPLFDDLRPHIADFMKRLKSS